MSELMATKQLNSLRPCPFCGAEAIMPVFRNASPAGYKVDVCTCSNDCEVIWDWKPIEAWNNRPIEDTLRARAERAEAMVERLIEAGHAMSNVAEWRYTNLTELMAWDNLVAEWKEREE